jgi:hypothetical protein
MFPSYFFSSTASNPAVFAKKLLSSTSMSRRPRLWLPILPRIASVLRPRILLLRLDFRHIHSTFDFTGILGLFLDTVLTILLRGSLHLIFRLVEKRRLARPSFVCSLRQMLQLPLSYKISLLFLYRRCLVASVLQPLMPLG